jgi:prolyl-tRNA synthetase
MFKSVLENETKYYMALIRGDYEVNEVKLKNAVNSPVDLELITDEEFEKLNITKGYCGALKNISEDIYVVADETIKPMKNMVIGANIKDKHYINANIERDIKIDKFYDIRMIKVGESCPHCDGTLEIARGIEVGQVFKLGTGYAEALGAKYLDENGKLQVMTMGCYGIGVSRTMAAAIEQNYDEYGIVWPVSIAPFVVNIIPANMKNETQINLAEKLYSEFSKTDIDTIIDDRNERLGFKMKDNDLIGLPIKLVVGKKADENIVEIKLRKTAETIEVNADEAINKVRELIKNL